MPTLYVCQSCSVYKKQLTSCRKRNTLKSELFGPTSILQILCCSELWCPGLAHMQPGCVHMQAECVHMQPEIVHMQADCAHMQPGSAHMQAECVHMQPACVTFRQAVPTCSQSVLTSRKQTTGNQQQTAARQQTADSRREGATPTPSHSSSTPRLCQCIRAQQIGIGARARLECQLQPSGAAAVAEHLLISANTFGHSK